MGSLRVRGGVFICYRWEETKGQAGHLYERLSARLGEDHVFMDVNSIASGVDFTQKVIEVLSGCNVLLALIGRNWPVVTDGKRTRRLDNPDDYVRVEIEIALRRGILIIPVLVDGAVLPKADELPPSLRPLALRKAFELKHTSFQSDVESLISDINAVIAREQQYGFEGIRIRAPAVDVSALAEALRLWYENQSLEAEAIATPTAVMVQCRTRQTLKHAPDSNALLTVILHADGENLLVDIGSGKWLGRTYAVKASMALVPWFPVALRARGTFIRMGVWRWRQHNLANQTISFLREAAPRHVLSA